MTTWGTKLLTAVFGVFLAMAAAAAQALEDRVVAVVNDTVITHTQLDARTKLVAHEMGLKDLTPAQYNGLAKRTLASMLDEALVNEDVARRRIDVTPAELAQTEEQLIAQGNTTREELDMLKKKFGNTWRDKFVADVRWQKVLATVLRPRVVISQAEIDRTLNEMLQNRQVLERELSQIMMKVDDPDKSDEVKARMEALLEKLQEGEDFVTMAKAYSDDSTGRKGGYMGWFANGQLNPALESALDNMEAGKVSELIRTPQGWHILRLDNVRTTKPVATKPVKEYDLVMIGYEGAADKELSDSIRRLVKDLDTKGKAMAWIEQEAEDGSLRGKLNASRLLGWVDPQGLQTAWQDAVAKARTGRWTPVVDAGGSVGALFVSGTRDVVPEGLVRLRERVREQKFGNKLELETRNYLRNLRQRAFVDVRL